MKPAPKRARSGLWWLACAAILLNCSVDDLVAVEAANDCANRGNCESPPDCAPVVCAAPDDALCQRATPDFQLGDGCSEPAALPSFRFALCSCSDLVTAHPLVIEPLPGQVGPAHLGLNGEFWSTSSVTLDGSIQAASSVRLDEASLQLGGRLMQQASPPCACGLAAALDLAPIVADVQRDNDNALLPIDPTDLSALTDARTVQLDCGRYYFDRIAGRGPLSLQVRAPALVVVAGNLELDGSLAIDVAANASLVWVVAGNIRVNGTFSVRGTDASLAKAKIIVGGSGTLQLDGETELQGALYAPTAELVTQSPFTLTGALLVRRAAPGAAMTVLSAPGLVNQPVCAQPSDSLSD